MPPPSPSPISPSLPQPNTPSLEAQASGENLPRWRQGLRDFSSRANNICFVITYPFMVVLTVIGLFVVIAFCIFPTLLLAIMVVCVYYCLTEDPIPLSVLLRYLLSVDEDEHGHPDHHTMAQNRPVVQKKLVVREVLAVHNKTDDTEESDDPPRKHPFPITIVTEKKILEYSAPLIFKDEEPNANENGEAAPLPVSHAFRPAPPCDEEAGIQLSSLASPQSPTVEQIQGGKRKNTSREEESAGEPTSDRLELPSGSNDSAENDVVNCTNAINDHHKLDEEKVEDEAENDGHSDDETGDSGAVATSVSSPLNLDNANEQLPSDTMNVPPVIDELKPNQEMQEEEVKEVIHDDYFGINEQQDRGTTCDICLLEFEPGDMVAWSPNVECSHCFHRDCILDWLVRKHSCPSCRKDYLKGAKDDGDPAPVSSSSFQTSLRPLTNNNNNSIGVTNDTAVNNDVGSRGSSSMSSLTH